MTIPNRNVSIKSVFASTANTTIPNPPAAGVSYRNTGTTAAEIGEGWAYKEIVDSAKFNQAMYEYTTICQQLEKYGFLPWSANTDYPAQGCALGSDGNVYQAKQATGPSSTSIDPTTDTNHTYWDLFYYSSVTANRALVSNGNGKMAASAVTATELGYLSGVSSAIQTQLNNKANNNAVVHLTGDETISGTKTFQGTGWNLYIKNTNVTYNTAPSSDTTTAIAFVDKNSQNMGTIDCFRLADNSTMMQFNIYGRSGAWARRPLEFKINSNGSEVAFAPASDVNDSIVTTVNKSKGTNGYFKLGNGMIVQWGRVSSVSSQRATVTLPTPFTSKYCPTGTCNYSTTTESGHGFIDNVSLTSFRINGVDSDMLPFYWVAVGY